VIYFLRRENDGSVKIGATTNLTRRLKQHRKKYKGITLSLMGIVDGGPKDERCLHLKFARLKVESTPICEWFTPAPELIEYIRDATRPWTDADDSPSNATPNGLVIRCLPEWRDWLNRLAEHDRTSMAGVIDRAAIDYARKIGFKEGAPKR
jgi:hypothetical protein